MQPGIISRDQHNISRKNMPQEVLKVLYRLHRTGHLAYLCGGGVRDLLLGRRVDDFDVATEAEPRRLKEIFANSRLVGRRFRIAHIRFKGGKLIEVSTFRKESEEEDRTENPETLLIKNDNTFGTPAEDAFRRDFTVNALFYNVADFSLIDYVGGREDLEARLIRCIGDPDVRLQEDPIRILRGIRLAAFLGFRLEEATWQAMKRHRHHLPECAVPRIREELLKILRRGNTHTAFELLADAEVLEFVFPGLHEFLRADGTAAAQVALFWNYLRALEQCRPDAPLSDGLLLAVLHAVPVLSALQGLPAGEDVGKWLNAYLQDTFKPLAIPRFDRAQAHLLLLALRHMLASGRRRRKSLRKSLIFDDALRLLEIHCRATNQHWSVLEHWRCQSPRRPRRRRRHKLPAIAAEGTR